MKTLWVVVRVMKNSSTGVVTEVATVRAFDAKWDAMHLADRLTASAVELNEQQHRAYSVLPAAYSPVLQA